MKRNVRARKKSKYGNGLNERGSYNSVKISSSNGGSIHSGHVLFNVMPEGLNFGHLNIQEICGIICVNSQK